MVDYSKWNKIEVSDDEDDTHPNIDTPSLFRWRHQARLERMAALDEKVKNFDIRKKDCVTKIVDLRKEIDLIKSNSTDSKVLEDKQKELAEFELKMKSLDEEERLLNIEVKSQPWNIDTICKEKFSKSMINTSSDKIPKEEKSEDVVDKLQQFVDKHKEEARHFGMISRPRDSLQYLIEHPYLASEEAANYLCIWCIDLAVEEKTQLMEKVAAQTVNLQFMLELAKSQNGPPQAFIRPYFSKLTNMEPEYKKSFDDELSSFKKRVHERAQIRLKEARERIEEEERQKRLGPGGLDPQEVFDSLPENLKECFEKKDVDLLKSVLYSMPPEEASYHFKRCVDSGLWVPGPSEGEEYETVENEDIEEIDNKDQKQS